MAERPADFSYENNVARIEAALETLRNGDCDVEEGMRLFKECALLVQECRDYLDSAELVVKTVSEKDGRIVEEDFE